MEEDLAKAVLKFRDSLGFGLRKMEVRIDSDNSHDETLSLALCQRFYGREEELRRSIEEAERIFGLLIEEHRGTQKRALLPYLELFSELLGEMHYIAGDFRLAAEWFMRTISFNRKDITPLIELLFSLRGMGEFGLFERGIFNLKKLYTALQAETGYELGRESMLSLIELAGEDDAAEIKKLAFAEKEKAQEKNDNEKRDKELFKKANAEGNYIANINYKCNANCLFCADSPEQRTKDDKDLYALLEELKDNRKIFEYVIISGGEPTIYPHLIEYIKAAKDLDYKEISIATNGILLASEAFVTNLIDAGVDNFQISFISVEPAEYTKITGIKDSYELVVRGIENIRKAKARFVTNIVIHKLNYRNLDKIVYFLISKGVDNINLAFMNPSGTSMLDGKSTLAISYHEAIPFVMKAIQAANNIGFRKIYIENFPICVAPGMIRWMADLKHHEANRDYYNNNKNKPEKCRLCRYYDVCEAVWNAYLVQFGDEELNPIIDYSH